MELKTVGDIRKLINHLDDDFKLKVSIMTLIPEEELKGSSYPYPWKSEEASLEYHDTGHSDKVISFGVYRGEKEEV